MTGGTGCRCNNNNNRRRAAAAAGLLLNFSTLNPTVGTASKKFLLILGCIVHKEGLSKIREAVGQDPNPRKNFNPDPIAF